MLRTRNWRPQNERILKGVLVKSRNGRNVSTDRSGRMLSMEGEWTVFNRRLSQFQPRVPFLSTGTIILFYFKNAKKDWRKTALQMWQSQKRKSFRIDRKKIVKNMENVLNLSLQPHDSLPVAGEAINDFWSMSGSFKNRHHVEPRVKLYSPREESFPIPLKHIDVSRNTHTNLDVVQERRIDDHWNIDGSRDLSDPWTGFTQYTPKEEKAPDGHMWSGGRLTRKQATSRPDRLWSELWRGMGRNAKLKERQMVRWKTETR